MKHIRKNTAIRSVQSEKSLHRLSLLAICLASAFAQAEEMTPTLSEVMVWSEGLQDDCGIGSTHVVKREKIEFFNGAGMISPYQAISLEPGVDIRNNDPLGVNVTRRIRGQSSRSNTAETLEGLPLKGIGPGFGLSTMVDMENVDSIAIEKGGIRADSGFGFGGKNGMVDLRIMPPSKTFTSTVKQSLGTDNFSKTYARLDTGELVGAARIFLSASHTEGDKFKGPGTGINRDNLAFGASGGSPQGVEWEIYGIYNDQQRDSYRGLTYAQSTDLSHNWNLDYNAIRTGNAANDINYYGYNREDYQTSALIGKLRIALDSDASLTFRPYYMKEKGHVLSGSASTLVNYANKTNVVLDWLVDHYTFGAVTEYEKKWKDSAIKLGYWYGEIEPPGPPTSRKAYDTKMNFLGWERIVGVEKRHVFNAPYVTYQQVLDKTVFDAGLKYLHLDTPALVSYKTAGIGNVSYDQALSQASVVDFTLPSKAHNLLLPSIGATHYLNDTALIKASYGKNYDTPSYDFVSGMFNYFKAIGYDNQKFQRMWSALKPEESDDFDLGYRYSSDRLSLISTLYYKRMTNINGNYYDPSLNLSYSQNVGTGRAYGLEFGSGYKLSNNLSLNLAFTYDNSAYTSDIPAAGGTTIAVKGKQLPDRPNYYGNLSAVYKLDGYRIAPVLRYLGQRYVDVQNQYSIGANWLMDLSVAKSVAMGDGHKLEFSLNVMNLFDRKYISTISTSDLNTTLNGPSYMVGGTKSVFASVQYKY